MKFSIISQCLLWTIGGCGFARVHAGMRFKNTKFSSEGSGIAKGGPGRA